MFTLDPDKDGAAVRARTALVESPSVSAVQALLCEHPRIVCYIMWYCAVACQPPTPPGEDDPMDGYAIRTMDAMRSPIGTVDSRGWASDYTNIGFAMGQVPSDEKAAAWRAYDAARHGTRYRYQPDTLRAFLIECLAAVRLRLSQSPGLLNARRWYLSLPAPFRQARRRESPSVRHPPGTDIHKRQLAELLQDAIDHYLYGVTDPLDEAELIEDVGAISRLAGETKKPA